MCEKFNIDSFEASASDYKLYQAHKKLLDSQADDLYYGRITAEHIHKPTVLKSYRALWNVYTKESSESFGRYPHQSRTTSEGFKRLSQVELNLLTFSALKNYNFLKAASQFKSQPVEQFRQSWDKLLRIHYERMMAVELQHVTSVANSVSEWQQVMDYAEDMPLLTYNTAGDERVREEHRSWDHITLPIGHPFWKTHFPPNGYNCRCWITQDFEIEADDVAQVPGDVKKPDKGFAHNFGQEGYCFTQDHGYFSPKFDELPVLNRNICALFQEHLNGYLKVSERVLIHPTVNPGEKIQNTSQAYRLSEKLQTNITLQPELPSNTGFKNPDTFIDGLPADFKKLENGTISGYSRAIKKANNQFSEILILDTTTPPDKRDIARIEGLFKKHNYAHIKQLWIQIGEDLIQYEFKAGRLISKTGT